MPVTYSSSRPYHSTGVFGSQFLDVMVPRTISKLASDVKYQIDKFYEYRPDLLASDLYGDPKLWWVFAMRNPNVLLDPLFDFYAGNIIYLPAKTTLQTELGI